MKTLLVLRHAKASQDSPSGSDFDRPLTSRGQRDSAAVGRALLASEHRPEAILASPAQRVVQTVAGVVQGAGWTLQPLWDRRLYNATLNSLVESISEVSDNVGTALIVGHNPGLKELIVHLAQEDDAGMRAQVWSGFPTATSAELRLRIDGWRGIGPGCGGIERIVWPSDQPAAPRNAG